MDPYSIGFEIIIPLFLKAKTQLPSKYLGKSNMSIAEKVIAI